MTKTFDRENGCYEQAPALPLEPQKPDWTVTFSHGFFPRKTRERSGSKIKLEKTFFWDNTSWYIPAAYACTGGLVIDFCVSAEAERFKAFWSKWADENGQELSYTEEEQLQIALENPLRPQFDASVLVNGKCLLESCSYGQSWLPPSCRPECFGEERKGRWIVEHYGLDKKKCWMFRRVSFPWVTKRKPVIRSMMLTLKQNPLTFPGPCFSVNGAGDAICFTHPISGIEHTLTVVEYEQQQMDTSRLGNSEMDYPSHYTAMTYALEPDLPVSAVSLQDCERSDRPRPKKVDVMFPQANNAIFLATIGSTDGPTTAFFATNGSQPHVACSALHFERQTNVAWRMTFHEKTIEDLTLSLL